MKSHLRARAAQMFARGMNRANVAKSLGISPTTAGKWYSLWKRGGDDSLMRTRSAGRRTKITPAGFAVVSRALTRGPRANGYDLDYWSLHAVTALIQRMLGKSYNPRHVGRLLRRFGWVVGPVGKNAASAMRIQAARCDPDLNAINFVERMQPR